MSSNINANSINAAFPVIDENQPSQGFRDNFSSIKSNFVIASGEITNLQNTYITVTGDIVSTSNVPLYQQNGEIVLNLKIANDSTNGTGGVYDSSINDISCKINPNGTISNLIISSTGKYTAFDTNNIIQFTKTTPDSGFSNYSSIKNITLSTISVDTFGKIISNGTKLIGDVNLYGHYIPNNNVLVGNSNNISTSISPTSSNQVLIYDGTTLKFSQLDFSNLSNVNVTALAEGDVLIYDGTTWKPQSYSNGTVTEITAGSGLKITNGGTTPQINYDFTSLPNETTISGTEKFITNISDTTYNYITTSQLLTYMSNNIDSSNTLSKLDIKNNKTISDTYIISYNSTLKTSYMLPLSSINNYDTTCVFVSNNGSDVSGDGSFINPYKTINYTVTKLTQTSHYNVILYGGTYQETISISSPNISISSLPGSVATIVGGIDYNTTTESTLLQFENINFNLNSGVISVNGPVNKIIINDCKLYNQSGNDSITLTASNSNIFITNNTIDGNINISTTNTTSYVYNNISENYINFNISSTSSSIYISDIKNCGSISHISGSLYLENIYNIYSNASITSSSSVSTDIFSFKNSSLKTFSNSTSDSYCNFTKTGTCPYVFENLDFNTSVPLSITGQAATYKSDIMVYPQICSLNLPGVDSSGNETITSVTLDQHNKYVMLTTYSNCTVILPEITTYNPNYPLDITFVFVPTYDIDDNGNPVTTETPVTNITFNNVTWHPDTPVIDYITNYQNIFKFTYIPANSTWIGQRIDSPSIKIDPDSNNLLQKTTNGYMVELKASDDVTNQYVSSSLGNDSTGDGTQAKPFKTIYKALSRIPDHTKVWIHLYTNDTFNFTDGFPNYVENGTLAQVNNGTFYNGSRNITFLPYGNTIYDSISSHPGLSNDSPDIGNQPNIQFTYSNVSDTGQYSCPGFNIDTGNIALYQISITVSTSNLPSTNTGASWHAPFTPSNGTLTTFGCNFNLSTGVVIGADGGNESTGIVVLGGTNYYNITNGTALIDSECGYTVRAPFSDTTGGNNIIINGTDTGLKQKAGNFNSAVANSNSFVNLTIINESARIYQGLITQNLIVQK